MPVAAQRKAKRCSNSVTAGVVGLLDLEPELLQIILHHTAANSVKDPTALLALACSCKTLHGALKVFPGLLQYRMSYSLTCMPVSCQSCTT